MATADEIAQLRRNVAELLDQEPYTDAFIDGLLATNTMNAASLVIWREKAARYAALVNVTEGSSSRSIGDLHTKALAMVDMYRELVDAEGGTPDVSRASRTRAIERA